MSNRRRLKSTADADHWLAAVEADPRLSDEARMVARVIAAGVVAGHGTADFGDLTFTVEAGDE